MGHLSGEALRLLVGVRRTGPRLLRAACRPGMGIEYRCGREVRVSKSRRSEAPLAIPVEAVGGAEAPPADPGAEAVRGYYRRILPYFDRELADRGDGALWRWAAS